MEVADSPVKEDDYSEVDSDDNYDDDFGEAEAPPDPIATPVADNYDDEDFGADVRWFAMKDRGSSGCSESVAAIASPSAFSTRLWCVARYRLMAFVAIVAPKSLAALSIRSEQGRAAAS